MAPGAKHMLSKGSIIELILDQKCLISKTPADIFSTSQCATYSMEVSYGTRVPPRIPHTI